MLKLLLIVMILAAIIGGCVIAIRCLNLDRPDRFRQVPHVMFTTVYVILSAVVFPMTLRLVDKIITLDIVTRTIMEGVPSECYGAAFLLLISLITNAIVMIVGVPVIAFALFCSKHSFEYKSFYLSVRAEGFADRFYNLSSGRGEVFLRPKHSVSAKWLKVMRIAVLIIFYCGVALAFIMLYTDFLVNDQLFLKILKYSYFIPMFTYLLISELYYFLDGELDGDSAISFESDVVDHKRIGDYSILMDFYRKRFSAALLNSEDCLIEKSYVEEYVFNSIGEKVISKCKDKEAFESVIESIKQNTHRLSDNYVDASVAMMNGECVVMHDTFFGEIGIYLAGYANYLLASGKKIVVVTTGEDRVDDIIHTLKSNLKKINDIDPIWIAGTPEENRRNEVDILVCSALDSSALESRTFLQKVGCVLIDDPNGTVSSSKAADYFADMKYIESLYGKSMQYIVCCSENSRNLEESLEHTFGQNFTSFRDAIIRNKAYAVVWKNESACKIQYQLKEQGAYMGTLFPILLVAASVGVSKIGIKASQQFPLQTYRDVVQGSINEIRQNLLTDGAINLNNIIEINNISQFTEDATLRFLIIADEKNNLLSLASNWCKYSGSSSTMIHIVSQPYMLRGYLAENLPELIRATSIVRQIVPNKGEDLQRNAETILLSLYEAEDGRPDYEIMAAYGYPFAAGCSVDDIEGCLEDMVRRVEYEKKSVQSHNNVYELFSFKKSQRFIPEGESGRYVSYFRVKMTNEALYNYLVCLRPYLHYRYGGNEEKIRLGVLKEDAVNYYIPNQIHCFKGELARVKTIDEDVVNVEKLSPKDYPIYEQIGQYLLRPDPECQQMVYGVENKYRVYDSDGELSGTIEGFFELTDGYRFNDPANYNRIILNESEQCILTPRKSRGLKIVIDREMEPETVRRFELTLVLMLNEVFKTVFPNNYRDIAAFVEVSDDWDVMAQQSSEEELYITQIIPTVRVAEEKAPDRCTPTVYILEKSCEEQGLVAECRERENLQNIFDILYEYLTWERSDYVKGDRFLQFGFETWPEILDLDDVQGFLDQVRTKNVANSKEDEGDGAFVWDGIPRCEYCGRMAIERIETSDDRIICDRCKGQIVTRQRELYDLYSKAKKAIQDYYGVKIPRVRKLCFKSRDEIRKAIGSAGDIVVGFYIRILKELWVERDAPKMFILNVLIHELTHAWQEAKIGGTIPKRIAEGHAVFVSLELLRMMKEEAYADYWVRMMSRMEDQAYYEGYMLFVEKCKKGGRRRNPFDVIRELMGGNSDDEDESV